MLQLSTQRCFPSRWTRRGEAKGEETQRDESDRSARGFLTGREERLARLPTTNHDVDNAHQSPNSADRQSANRLGLGITTTQESHKEDRNQHDQVGQQTQDRDGRVPDKVVILE